MRSWTDTASIVASLSVGALLLWLAWPQPVPAETEQVEKAEPVLQQPNPIQPTPIQEDTPALASIRLPPPPVLPEAVEAQPPRPTPKPAPATKPQVAPAPKTAPQEATPVATPAPAPAPAKPQKTFAALKPSSPKSAAEPEPETVTPVRQTLKPTKAMPRPKPADITVAEPDDRTIPATPDYADTPEAQQDNRALAEAIKESAGPDKGNVDPDWRQQADAKKVAVSTAEHSPDARAGRALLRLSEHGQGPVIEIAWPGNAAENEHLYHRLTQCFGMVNAIVTGDGKLFSMQSPAGRVWQPNIDRYSGFIREPAGRPIPTEQRNALEIRRRHGLGPGHGRVVRVFPRNVDAAILGGLQAVIGGRYQGFESVHAAYRLVGGQLEVTNIIGDGTPFSETIAVAPVRRCGDVK